MYDLVVIGGGSGGLVAAKSAARVGARVALIEKRRPGGECTFTACVPSKGLVQAARLVRQVRDAEAFGIHTADVRVDFPAILSRIRAVVEGIAAEESEEKLRRLGIDVYHGAAAFDAYDTVLLDGERRVEGQRFIVATGSRPASPAVPGLAEAGSVDHTSLWSLGRVPESLAIIGAGPIGLEFAQIFARFGSKVTVLADSDRILPREDEEVASLVQRRLAAEGITFHVGISLEKVEVAGGRKLLRYRGGRDGAAGEVKVDEILVAAGRLANVEGLNLEEVGIHADPAHGIEVDDLLQTHAPRVFAIGDVLLREQYTHAAEREAEIALENALFRRRKRLDHASMPWATFTDPEVATVGVSEAQAKAQQLEYRVFRVDYADVDRARIDGRTDGFAKVVASPSGKILGATIVGDEASLLLQQIVLAKESDLGLGALASAVQIYPTYAGVIRELSLQFQASRLKRGYVQTALKLFYGFLPRTGGPEEAPILEPSVIEDVDHTSHAPATAHGHGH